MPHATDPAGHLPCAETSECLDSTGVNDFATTPVPPEPPAGSPQAERDAHWRRHVYLGDSQRQLTVRAVLIGGVLGGLMSVTGLYITLKTGWGLGLTIIATLGSFTVMNLLTRLTKGRIAAFTMLENNCMGSTATSASASTGMTMVGCFGGMMLVGETGVNPHWVPLTAVVFFTALFGLFLSIPIKRRMVNEEDLAYPSPKAGAEMLRGLYADGAEGARKAKVLFLTLVLGGLVGLFRNWQVLADKLAGVKISWGWLNAVSKFSIPEEIALKFLEPAAQVTTAGLAFEPSLLLTSVGLIVGMRVAASMFVGSCLLYFVLTPAMMAADAAHAGEAGWHVAMLVKEGVVTPTKWALWGGTALMVVSSFTTLALQWKTLARSFTAVLSKADAAKDPIADLEVPMKWAVYGGVPCGLGLVLALWLGFGVNPVLGTLALMLSCATAIVCCRASAEADINPIGAMGKVTQLVFAVLPGAAGSAAINLVSAGSTSAAAGSSADMMGDFKCSRLLGANARQVFLAQFWGVFFGIVCVIPAWYVIVPNREALDRFAAVPAKIWSAVAKLLTEKSPQLAAGVPTLMVVCAVLGVAIPVVAHLRPKLARYLPSTMGLGLSLTLPFSTAAAFLTGAVIMAVWEKGHRKSAASIALIVASGLMSGQAITESVMILGGEIAATCGAK